MRLAITVNALQASATVTFDAAAGENPQPVRLDWGDGGAVQQLASGFANPTTHTYGKAGFYKVVAQANDVRATESVRVGSPAFPAYGAKHDRRRENVNEDAAVIAGTKGQVG